MSKKIVLKSVLAVVVVGFILSMSSCQKEEKKIIGVWKYEKMEVTDFACSDPVVTAMAKPIVQQYIGFGAALMSGIEIEFTKEGTVITRSLYGNGVATYKVNGSTLTITDNGSVTSSEISFPNKKTLCITEDADRADLEGFSETLQEDLGIEVQVVKLRTAMTLTKK